MYIHTGTTVPMSTCQNIHGSISQRSPRSQPPARLNVNCFSDHLESKQFHLSLPLWPVRWSSNQCGHRSQSRATWLKVVGSGGAWQTKELRFVRFYLHVATQTMKSTWLLGTSRIFGGLTKLLLFNLQPSKREPHALEPFVLLLSTSHASK